jgi:hypothetical protein
MQTKEQIEKAHMVFVRDTNSGIISRIAFPEDVQIGLSNKPSELMLTGRLSLSTANYTCEPGSEITINNDTIYALVSATSSQAGSLTVRLPAAPRDGQWVIIKDASGNASNQNIIVKPQNSSIKIDGLAQSTITSPYGSFAVIWKNGEWKGAFGRSGDGTPGGVNKQVQFNDDGMFGGDPYFLFDKTNHSLTASNTFITGNLNVKGYVELSSTDTSIIPSDKTAGYLYLSGSTQDIYFTQYDPTQTYTSTTRLRWLESELSTGLLHGGILSTQNGSTTFSIGSGSGIFVKYNASLGNDPYPTVKLIEWQPFVSESLTYVTSKQISYIGVDSNKNIVQRSSPFTVSDSQDYIFLGRILHQVGSVTNGAVTSPHVAYGSNQWQFDYIKSLGPLKISGHVLSPAGANLQLNKTNGTSYVFGRNYTFNPNSPNIVPPANDYAVTVSKIFREYVNGSGNPVIDSNGGVGYTTIDPTQYNNGGTLASVASGKYTVQRAYWYPASVNKAIYVYYGNAIYNSIADAKSGFDSESFVEGDNTSTEAILLGYIIVKANATDLTNTSDALILQAGPLKFSGGGGGGGGGGGSTVPGGADTYVQFNDVGAFGGESSFTYNKTTNTLTVDNLSGSLTRLSNGSSYLVAGTGVTISSGSSGQITITNASPSITLEWNERLSGTVDGVNTTFTLAHTPVSSQTIMVFLNGMLLEQGAGNDFTIAGSTVTLSEAPLPDSKIIATYSR